jgi:hypothetical protein
MYQWLLIMLDEVPRSVYGVLRQIHRSSFVSQKSSCEHPHKLFARSLFCDTLHITFCDIWRLHEPNLCSGIPSYRSFHQIPFSRNLYCLSTSGRRFIPIRVSGLPCVCYRPIFLVYVFYHIPPTNSFTHWKFIFLFRDRCNVVYDDSQFM